MKYLLGLLTLTLAQQLMAQEIRVGTVPDEVVSGSTFVVTIEGRFPTPCSLDSIGEVSIFGNELTISLAQDDAACIQVITDLSRAFGPFTTSLEPGEQLAIALRSEGEEAELAATTVSVVGDAEPGVALRSGVYWDSDFVGNGIAIEVQGDSVFVGALGYRSDGQAQWQAAVGRMSNGAVEAELSIFANGDCLVCGDSGEVTELVGSAGVFQLTPAGSSQAFLSFGDEPGRALTLRPFTMREVDSEGTIAGVTFRMPDLSGRWLFADLAAGATHVVVELSQVFSGISDSGLAFFANSDGSFTVQCSARPTPAFVCDVYQDGMLLFSAGSQDLSHDQILTSEFAAIRLD